MRISSYQQISSSQFPAEPTPQRDADKVAPIQSNQQQVETVRVTVSEEAKKLAENANTAFDDKKVAKLREAIQKGTFRVNAKAIAAKLVDTGG